jgi:hypothetical protein
MKTKISILRQQTLRVAKRMFSLFNITWKFSEIYSAGRMLSKSREKNQDPVLYFGSYADGAKNYRNVFLGIFRCQSISGQDGLNRRSKTCQA